MALNLYLWTYLKSLSIRALRCATNQNDFCIIHTRWGRCHQIVASLYSYTSHVRARYKLNQHIHISWLYIYTRDIYPMRMCAYRSLSPLLSAQARHNFCSLLFFFIYCIRPKQSFNFIHFLFIFIVKMQQKHCLLFIPSSKLWERGQKDEKSKLQKNERLGSWYLFSFLAYLFFFPKLTLSSVLSLTFPCILQLYKFLQ